MLQIPVSLMAIGTYAEGFVVGKITQLESRGVLFDSYEGILEVTNYNKEEKCEEAKDECFSLSKQKIDFSVRPDNSELVNLLLKSMNQEFVFGYKIHRIKSIFLSSEFELLTATKQESTIPSQLGEKFISSKTGGKRNFSVSGKILQLDYQGTFIGTYEGLYLDEVRGKIHPFSITSDDMATYAFQTMRLNTRYYLGVSVAYFTGFRKSNFDLFEINFKEPAGSVPMKLN
jgi:hypothetical protein